MLHRTTKNVLIAGAFAMIAALIGVYGQLASRDLGYATPQQVSDRPQVHEPTPSTGSTNTESREALGRAPTPVSVLIENLARGADLAVAIRAKDYRRATEIAAAATQATPQQESWRIVLGEVFICQERWPEAIESFNAAKIANPKSLTAEVGIADVLRVTGNAATAEQKYTEVLKTSPNFRASFGMGCIRMEGRSFAEAIPHFRASIEAEPQTAAYINMAQCYARVGDLGSAEASYRKLVETEPDSSRFHSLLAHCLLTRGLGVEATVQFRAALRLDPNDSSYHFGLGKALELQADQADHAIQEFRRAAELDPTSAASFEEWARVLRAQNNPRDALGVYRRGLEESPHAATLLWEYGNTLAEVEGSRDAIDTIRKYLDKAGDVAAGRNVLGHLQYDFRKDYRSAAREFSAARNLDATNGAYWWNSALCYERLGENNEAVVAYRRASELSADYRDRVESALGRIQRLK